MAGSTLSKTMRAVVYGPTAQELPSRKFRRSLYAVKDIKKGELLTLDNIRSIRPGYGLAPKFLDLLLGKHAACDINRGTALSIDLVA